MKLAIKLNIKLTKQQLIYLTKNQDNSWNY